MTTPLTTPLALHRRADSDRRQDAVRRALSAMSKTGEDITVSSVARRAGVHRSLIYRHPELQAAVDAAAALPTSAAAPRGDQVSTASLRASVENERERNRRLTLRLAQLERRLSEALGREAFRDAGLDDVDQTRALEERVLELEQTNNDMRRKLRDTKDELDAAQHVNQQLTRQLNRA
jgi:chromosome segregation ATPase